MSLPLRLKEPTRETLAKAIVVVLPTLAYLNSFSGAFVFDDEVNILKNPSIRHLGSLGAVLSPPALSGAGGRPLTNLSLALNYALSGSQEWSYHALSLAIHLGCALLLFAILRETFRSPRLPPALIGQSVVIAGTAATLWAVHPVQTATVTSLLSPAPVVLHSPGADRPTPLVVRRDRGRGSRHGEQRNHGDRSAGFVSL